MFNDRNRPRLYRDQISGQTLPPVGGGGGGYSFDSETEAAYAFVVDEAVFVQGSDEPNLNSYTFTSEATSRAALT